MLPSQIVIFASFIPGNRLLFDECYLSHGLVNSFRTKVVRSCKVVECEARKETYDPGIDPNLIQTPNPDTRGQFSKLTMSLVNDSLKFQIAKGPGG